MKSLLKENQQRRNMRPQQSNRNRISTILILFVTLNIIGDVGNVAFWWASPDSRTLSLNTGYIGNAVGADYALIAGTVILLVVAAVYAISLFGLFRKQKWGPILVAAISIVNRVLAVFLYLLSPAFAFWAIWTVILVAVAYLDFKKMQAPKTPTTQKQTA
jgi:magnesium-transporting ATPase (P-type)